MSIQNYIDVIKKFTSQLKMNRKEINANQYRGMYSKMGVNIDKLGCIMIDVDGSSIQNIISEGDLYTTANKDRHWINGFVAGKTPHVTLLYGLLESGNTTYRNYVDEVLKGWQVNSVKVDHIGFFDSPYTDEPYYCIVAHLQISDQLKDGNNRLQLLPHINTFPDYKAHITIAYINKDEALRDKTITDYESMLKDKELATKGINYGK